MALNTLNLYSISSDLKSLGEVLGKRSSRVGFYISGTDVANELPESSKGILDSIREDYIRRKAAPILDRLLRMGATVDVDFDYREYLDPDEDEEDK